MVGESQEDRTVNEDAMAVMHTCSEVAVMTGLAPVSIRAYAKRYLVGRKMGRDWFFVDSDVAQIMERRSHRGRPPKVDALPDAVASRLQA
jgi:hypothetical protein